MVERVPLRRVGDPVGAAPPAGVRIRTRIHVTETAAAALTAIGAFLGSVYRTELAGRVRLGLLDRKSHAVWRADRRQVITRCLRRGGPAQSPARSRTSTSWDARPGCPCCGCSCGRPGELAPAGADQPGMRPRRRRGYRNAGERFAKTRRPAVLRARLSAAEDAVAAGRPSITVGGKRLWRNRNHLDERADLTELQWRARWDAARMFLTADGEA
jgi:hypothetical protein